MPRPLFKSLSLVLILTLLPAFGSSERLFAPSADLWARWQAADPGSVAALDHSGWDRFLRAHVRDQAGPNLVDYAGAVRDRAALDEYLSRMAKVAVSGLNRREQMAYWINIYNALTVKVVLDHLPIESIRDIDISPGILSSGPWDAELIRVEGEDLTLNDIEHRILRPIWRDPRIHYGVNCASIGCPDLQPRAFTGKNIDQALDAAARAYVNDPRGVDVRGGRIIVSSIYDWFIEDFGGNEAGVVAHLKKYAKPDLRRALDSGLYGTAYDWSLNGTTRRGE